MVTTSDLCALLILFWPGPLMGSYNCSDSSSPWIYIYESNITTEVPISYDGEPLRDLDGMISMRIPTLHTLLVTDQPAAAMHIENGSAYLTSNLTVDLPPAVIRDSVTYDYEVHCKGGKRSSLAIVVVDENNQRPRFLFHFISIDLRESWCIGKEIFNFAYLVEDNDFADKPNQEKLQLVILQSKPLTNIFSVSGRLGLRIDKPWDSSTGPYTLTLTIRDQAMNYGNNLTFEVYTYPGTFSQWSSTLNKTCKPLVLGTTGFYDELHCGLGSFDVVLRESEIRKGLRITYGGYLLQNLSSLSFNGCNVSGNSSFRFLDLTDDGGVVVNTYFDVDSLTREGSLDTIICKYEFPCTFFTYSRIAEMRVLLLDENDEAPTFIDGVPRIYNISQVEERVYSYRHYVRDVDSADWPNDDRLELVIASPPMNSCGETVANVFSITERLALRVLPVLNDPCKPYTVNLALKDHSSRIGEGLLMTFVNLEDASVNGPTIEKSSQSIRQQETTTALDIFNAWLENKDLEVYCATVTIIVNKTQVVNVTLPKSRAPSTIRRNCWSTGELLLIAQCEQLSHNSSHAEYIVMQSTASCSDATSLPLLADLYLEPITESNVLELTSRLRNITTSPLDLQPVDLGYASLILENIAQFYENSAIPTTLKQEVSSVFSEVVSNIMDVDANVIKKARQKDLNITARIIQSFDIMLMNLANSIAKQNKKGTTENQLVLYSKNLAYKITTEYDVAGIGICSLINETKKMDSVFNDYSPNRCLHLNGVLYGEIKLAKTARGLPKVFVVYMSASLLGSEAAPGSFLLSAQLNTTLAKEQRADGEHFVVLRHRINKTTVAKGYKLACGFWNFSINRWDSNGCSPEPTEDERGLFVCSCDHLTNFALLMVPCLEDCSYGLNDDVLSYLSLILLAVSSVALTIALVTFFVYRELHKSTGQRLTACLSASLLCMNLLFIFGIKAADKSDSACSALAVALHYFLLTTFLFMTAEVILSYLLLVKVIDAHVSHFMWKVLAICLGLPAVPVLGARFGDPSLYTRGDRYCWVHPTVQIYGVMLPVGMTISFNLVMFILIARALAQRPKLRCSVSDRIQANRQAKALAAIFVLLGITWAFGLLAAIKDSSMVFQYLFVITNALQGLFLFIFHNVKAPSLVRCLKNVIIRTRASTVSNNKCSDVADGETPPINATSTEITESRKSVDVQDNPALPIKAAESDFVSTLVGVSTL